MKPFRVKFKYDEGWQRGSLVAFVGTEQFTYGIIILDDQTIKEIPITEIICEGFN